MFYNFTAEMFNTFKESRHPSTGNYRFPKKVAEAYYSDIIRELPKFRVLKPLEWSEGRIECKEITELFDIISGASRVYDCYFSGLEHNGLTLALCHASSFENLEERVKAIISDPAEEYKFFDFSMNLNKRAAQIYGKYSDFFKLAEKFSKVTHIEVEYTSGEREFFFRNSNKNKLGYNYLTHTLLNTYFKKFHADTFSRINSELSFYRDEISKISDPKGNIIIAFE